MRDCELTTKWAAIYRERGFNPLPSRTDEKRPCCRFSAWWESPTPASLFDRFPTSNIQVMTGRHWRLLVIDLDGPEAIERWKILGSCPRTWAVHSGGAGHHLWFRLPSRSIAPLPKAVLWKGPGDHQAIERMCDHSLVMAPPSIHPKTGVRYRFLPHQSPVNLGMPADCPRWVLDLKPIAPERKPAPVRVRGPINLRDPVGLAQHWGVRIAGAPSAKGWIPCHAIDREDSHPSAAIHQQSGFYVDHASGARLNFAELAVALHVYHTPAEAWKDFAR